MKFPKNHKSLYRNALLITPFLFAIAACSGGGDSSPQPTDTTPPSITVTSHTDGQEIIGDRTITLQGTVSDDTQSVSILLNGTNVTATLNGNSFSANIILADRENILEISAADDSNNRSNISVNLFYPFLSLTNGQAASMVIGQPDFTSSAINRGAGIPSANSLSYQSGSAAVTDDGKLYVPDCGNNRILIFNQIPDSFDVPADFVIGQDDFVSNSENLSDHSFSCPSSVRIYGNRMFVTDVNNNRVLIWNTLPTSNNEPASIVLGQSAFDTGTSGCDARKLNFPIDTVVANNKIIVADTLNNRALIWNDIENLSNGKEANIVLGQADFVSCQGNRGDVLPDANTFWTPTGVWSDGSNLIVADNSNNRVLIWNVFPTTNGSMAEIVLGQSDMQSYSLDVCQSCLHDPAVVFSNGNQLFVGDSGNNRLLVWDSMPSASNTPADRVIGQSDFDSLSFDTSETTFVGPWGIVPYGSKLIVSDGENTRIMIYDAP